MDHILIESEINASKLRDQSKDILENIREMDNYAPLTQRRVLEDNLPQSSSDESEFGQIRISDLFPRKFLSTKISKTDSFEFGHLKEEIEFTSTQIPGFEASISQKERDNQCCSTWLAEDISIKHEKDDVRATSKTFASRCRSIIYIDQVESKFKMEKQSECITINDSSDIEEPESYVERRGNTGWYQRYNQELEERERRGELTPPRTTRPISSIKITKLNKKTKQEDTSEENSLTPTQLLYPSSLEKEFLGSQNDINFFNSCLEAEHSGKQAEKRQIKQSASIEDIKKSKLLKKFVFEDIYDDELCINEQEREEKRSIKPNFYDNDIYDNEESDD